MNKKLLAFSLGDGSVDKRYILWNRQCKEQEDYLIWKHTEIEKEIPCSCVKQGIQNGFQYSAFYTKTNKTNQNDLKEIREKLYDIHGVKYFSKEIVNEMDWFCFAVLYMDDGSLTAKKRNGIIHAYDLTISIYGEKEECENLISKLNELGLKFTLKSNKGKYSIRCGTKNARKFIEYIKPYCPNLKCFEYTKFKPIITDSTYLIETFKQNT